MAALGEPRVPKPKSQGDKGPSTPKAPLRGGNSQGSPGGSFKRGVSPRGTHGSGRTSNRAPRT